MKTIRIIVKDGEIPNITVSREKGKKGLLTFLSGKKKMESLPGKEARKP